MKVSKSMPNKRVRAARGLVRVYRAAAFRPHDAARRDATPMILVWALLEGPDALDGLVEAGLDVWNIRYNITHLTCTVRVHAAPGEVNVSVARAAPDEPPLVYAVRAGEDTELVFPAAPAIAFALRAEAAPGPVDVVKRRYSVRVRPEPPTLSWREPADYGALLADASADELSRPPAFQWAVSAGVGDVFVSTGCGDFSPLTYARSATVATRLGQRACFRAVSAGVASDAYEVRAVPPRALVDRANHDAREQLEARRRTVRGFAWLVCGSASVAAASVSGCVLQRAFPRGARPRERPARGHGPADPRCSEAPRAAGAA